MGDDTPAPTPEPGPCHYCVSRYTGKSAGCYFSARRDACVFADNMRPFYCKQMGSFSNAPVKSCTYEATLAPTAAPSEPVDVEANTAPCGALVSTPTAALVVMLSIAGIS